MDAWDLATSGVKMARAVAIVVATASATSALAQAVPHPQPRSPAVDSSEVEDERQKLTQRIILRQIQEDERTFRRWGRWTYAVCIGCNPLPRDARRVYTYPLRVLAGIPAYVDDARMRLRRRAS